jgi:tetratricopeptide (TPR) repeat protein
VHRDRRADRRDVLVLLAAAFLCTGQPAVRAQDGQGTATAPPLTATLADARKLIDAGLTAAALDKLRPVREASPLVDELIGVAYYRANDAPSAIDAITPILPRLAAGSIERREALQVLGLSHLTAGHIAQSIPYLEEFRRLVPDDPKAAYALGTAYAQTRQPARAREAFARAFGVAPESAAAHLLAGQMMNRLELEELAEPELKDAIRMDPRLPDAHYVLAQIAIFRSRFDEALALLRAELALNPAHAMALYRLGDVYARQQQWSAAIAALQQSLWINPYYSGPYILLGKAYSKTGQPGAAEDMLRRAIEYDPNNKSAHYLLAQVLQQAGKAEEAKREFAIAERLQGDIK